MQLSLDTIEEQFQYFPGTRYMGSKNKIIYDIWQRLEKEEFESVLDTFGGSNVVGYFLKCQGKKVITNDFMSFSYITSKAIIENSSAQITKDDLKLILKKIRITALSKRHLRIYSFLTKKISSLTE